MHLKIDKSAWLYLTINNGVWIQDAGRVAELVSKMTRPVAQYPRLIHFIGRQSKDQAIRALFPESTSRRTSTSSVANLRMDLSTCDSASPLLLADSNPFETIFDNGLPLDSNLPSIETTWSITSPREVTDILHARYFFLFCDVICVFLDDFSDIRELAVLLIEWARIARSSSLPSEIRPKVVIVSPPSGGSGQPIVQDYVNGNDRKEMESAFNLAPPFYLTQGDSQLSLLKTALLSHVQEIHDRRHHNGSLFSARHFEAFSSQALEHVAKTISNPFDFISTSRRGNEVGDDYVDHVSNLLRLGLSLDVPYTHLASFFASSILMDAYPPNMHCESPMISCPILANSLRFPSRRNISCSLYAILLNCREHNH
jgi:hypothetical protein